MDQRNCLLAVTAALVMAVEMELLGKSRMIGLDGCFWNVTLSLDLLRRSSEVQVVVVVRRSSLA